MALDATTSSSVGIALLIAFEIPNLYSGLLPSQFTISTFAGSDEAKQAHTVKVIRKSEVQATVMSIGLALGGTILTKEPWPILAALVMIAWLIYQYESALRSGCKDGPGMDIADQDATAHYQPAGY